MKLPSGDDRQTNKISNESIRHRSTGEVTHSHASFWHIRLWTSILEAVTIGSGGPRMNDLEDRE